MDGATRVVIATGRLVGVFLDTCRYEFGGGGYLRPFIYIKM